MTISAIIYTILSILFGIIWLIVYLVTDEAKKGRRRISPNSPIVLNFARKQFTNGYAFGEVKSQKQAKNGCTLIEFYPIDVEHGEHVPKPDLQSVIIKNEFIDRYAKGELPARREVIILNGMKPSDYPEKYQRALEGKGAISRGEMAYISSTYNTWMDNVLKTLSLQMKGHAGGLINVNAVKEIKAGAENIKEMMTNVLLNQPSAEKKE